MNASVVRFIVAAVIVTILGGLAGWYMFVNRQIAVTDITDSARGFGGGTLFGADLGSGLSNLTTGGGGSQATTTASSGAHAPTLWQITRTPVAGMGFSASSSKLYFAERSSGNILTAEPVTSKIERITNTLFPKIIEAVFAGDGSVVLRLMSEDGLALSFAGRIATSTSPAAGDTPHKLEGIYLPEGIASLAAREAANDLFYIFPDATVGAAGIVSDWSGNGQKRVFASSLTNWRAIALADGSRYVVQKASDDVTGYAYKIATNGTLERVAGGVAGLTILPRANSSALLYSSSENGRITLYAKANTQAAAEVLPIRTVAEKCVWAPGTRLIAYCAVPQSETKGQFLKSWYEGSVHTEDAWWRVDVAENTVEQFFTPQASVALDVENPRIDGSGTYIAFQNGLDKNLWMLTVE